MKGPKRYFGFGKNPAGAMNPTANIINDAAVKSAREKGGTRNLVKASD